MSGSSSGSGYLSGVCALVLEQGLGRARAQILCKQLESRGGKAEQKLSEDTTHILVGKAVRGARVASLLKVASLPETVLVLRADWLSACLVKGGLEEHAAYVVTAETPQPSPSKLQATAEGSPVKTQSPAVSPLKSLSPVRLPAREPPVVSPVRAGGDRSESGAGGGAVSETEDKGSSSTETAQKGLFPNVSWRWQASKKKTVWDTLDSDSDYQDSGEEGSGEEREGGGEDGLAESGSKAPHCAEGESIVGAEGKEGNMEEEAPPPKRKRRWICEIASSEVQTWVNHNKHITDKLQELLTVYKNAGDKWRAMSCTKAIQAVRKHHKEITTFEEARSLPFVGERLADKIWEIVSTSGLRRLENVDQEREAVISLFKDIHGVGLVTAQQFHAQGYRTLDDLRQSGILNRQQLIGIKHYDEFRERMQRSEVEEISAKVKEVALSICPGLEVVTCGSYRRGKPTCGDVDILITHPDGRSHKGLFSALMQKCTAIGFFTDDLTIHNDPEGSCKYLGVCKLPGEGRKHRRIDIFVVPYSEFPLALLHFTGSSHYNRSLRSKADRMGMSLSEHSLNTGVIRKNGVKVFNGTPLPVFSEEDVFKYLNVQYRDAKERDWD